MERPPADSADFVNLHEGDAGGAFRAANSILVIGGSERNELGALSVSVDESIRTGAGNYRTPVPDLSLRRLDATRRERHRSVRKQCCARFSPPMPENPSGGTHPTSNPHWRPCASSQLRSGSHPAEQHHSLPPATISTGAVSSLYRRPSPPTEFRRLPRGPHLLFGPRSSPAWCKVPAGA
jgi:hypothetical protein